MKPITETRYLSYDGNKYDTEEQARIADIVEQLKRFVGDEMYTGIDKASIADVLVVKRDTLSKLLAGEPIYLTDQELKEAIK